MLEKDGDEDWSRAHYIASDVLTLKTYTIADGVMFTFHSVAYSLNFNQCNISSELRRA